MKIHQNRNINTSSTAQKKKTSSSSSSSSKFGPLFTSELDASPTSQEALPEHPNEESASPAQQRAAFKQATELLGQAMEQWEIDGSLTESSIASIQQARQQLGLLSAQDPTLAQAETILAVESKRLQMLNH